MKLIIAIQILFVLLIGSTVSLALILAFCMLFECVFGVKLVPISGGL